VQFLNFVLSKFYLNHEWPKTQYFNCFKKTSRFILAIENQKSIISQFSCIEPFYISNIREAIFNGNVTIFYFGKIPLVLNNKLHYFGFFLCQLVPAFYSAYF
jgi:hypothetical protein